jgi:3-oxoadipate enol-lactonase
LQFARLNGVTLHYQVIPGRPGAPRIVFVNSLGTDFRIWRDVIVRLAGDYSVLCYDMRGHGLTGIGETPYTIEALGADLATLIEHADFGPAIVCGLSVGGLVAQELYRTRPQLVRALVLCGTLPKIGNAEGWAERIAAVRGGGIAAISEKVLGGWFTQAMRSERAAEYEGYRAMLERQPAEGYLATVAAIRDADLTAAAPKIGVPAICVVGESDPTTTPAKMAEMAKAIPGARYEMIRGAGHIPCVEQPETVAEIVRAFTSIAGVAHAA